ncbi:3',5'-cyclic adenosine monophosphate phosphodiesterase CpdA [Rhodovastum atsumiense]|uniref:Phosphodiesterase n=1 Tax=Rhodovastum atsumiense TaxID=504468 RepID=A0A5M6IXJ4_9PROT|nr:phosphodiesterase [Rhodovastum atsumiense]KAA5613012.1 phosphodiesterase [Rhodovastum atsumiense]CAH2600137.1 3',5'-cyclic adenosine monophosphate phosphodiesterase CpdA [Rhodovastum atsumiense]
MILAQLTDLHVRPPGLPAMRICETNMLTERALLAVRDFRPRPDAVVITGDLTANGLAAEYRNFAGMLARLIDMPVYVVPGNHDDREVLRSELAHLPGVTSHPRFVQYVVEDLPVRLVMLDTLIPGRTEGELCAERLAWLEATLAAAPDRPTMIGMHHPPFACGVGHMDRIILRDPAAFAAVVARHRQVQRIICGHHHRVITGNVAQAIASVGPGVAHIVELDLFDDKPSAWRLEPPAFQLHVQIAGGGIVSHTAFVERYPGPFPFIPDPI